MLEKLSILIACPDLESRTKLREVLKVSLHKAAIENLRSLHNFGTQIVELERSFDLVFLASSFGKEKLEEVLPQIKNPEAGANPHVIVFINQNNTNFHSDVASLYLSGVDGFIAEPYSSNELMSLLATIKESATHERISGDMREGKAADFLLVSASGDLDELALRRKNGDKGYGYEFLRLKKLKERLEAFAISHAEDYLDRILKIFSEAKPFTSAIEVSFTKKATPHAVHPGQLLRDMMKARSLERDKLLGLTRIEPAYFDQIVEEKAPIDETAARELSRVLGMTAREWLTMQAKFDAYERSKKDAPAAE